MMRAYKDPTADAAIANVMKEQKGKLKQTGRSKRHPCRNRTHRDTERGGLNGSPFSHSREGKGKGGSYDRNI